ncbi:hypothetical protein [Vibrio hippocampi]|uniref:Uncharacterized protein n=1 Tax=Vibrio hippocampi TaxID=654686 RepID=A0ABN8DGJ5_9VIBR|nr:hypothetical protein [Vibrio hippocampi]CAH0525650.1 hypothetical protein VHP8226_01178 [Vibrio hippocampi]
MVVLDKGQDSGKGSRETTSAALRNNQARKRIFILGDANSELTAFAFQQLNSKCFGLFDIVCYSVSSCHDMTREKFQCSGHFDPQAENFLEHHYDVMIAVGLNVIQVVKQPPSYDKLLFWDIEGASDEYDAVVENVNYFISRYLFL